MGFKIIIIFFLFAFTSCSVSRKTTQLYNIRDVECVSEEMDGTVTLIAYGSGRNKRDAICQAKKNALHQIIFIGTDNENNTCLSRPLVGEVNAKDKYSVFFNEFFKDKGLYRNYVSRKDEKLINRFNNYLGKNKYEVTFSIILRVQVPALTDYLKTNNIITDN